MHYHHPPSRALANHRPIRNPPTGLDLEGNTYWVFRLPGTGGGASPVGAATDEGRHWRRIVKYPRSTQYSEVKVSPTWHQWLRYRRADPPTLTEQVADVARQERLRRLAAEADARWAAKPSLSDMPAGATQPQEQVATREHESSSSLEEGVRERVSGLAGPENTTTKPPAPARPQKQEQADPWKKAATGPGETWQPAAWAPSSSRKR